MQNHVFLRRSGSSTSFGYTINNINLDYVTSYKYLGIQLTNNLSWHAHIEYITNNSNRSLGYLRRNFSKAPSHLKLMLYKTLIRPKLEYASSVWDPGQKTLSAIIESVQNRSARFINSNYTRTSSVSLMKSNLGLIDLQIRRKISRLCLFHKILYQNNSLKQELISQPSYISSRLDHQYKVFIPFCRTNVFSDSFLPKTSAERNHLPPSIASIEDVSSFKTALTDHILSL